MKRHIFVARQTPVIVLCCLVLIVLFGYCVYPQIQSFFILVEKNGQLEHSIVHHQKLSDAFKEISQQSSLIEKRMPAISSYSKVGVPSVSNMRVIKDTVTSHNIQCEIEVPAIIHDRDSKKLLQYSVSFAGPFKNCTEALKDLVLLPMVVSADSFLISSIKNGKETVFNVQLTVALAGG